MRLKELRDGKYIILDVTLDDLKLLVDGLLWVMDSPENVVEYKSVTPEGASDENIKAVRGSTESERLSNYKMEFNVLKIAEDAEHKKIPEDEYKRRIFACLNILDPCHSWAAHNRQLPCEKGKRDCATCGFTCTRRPYPTCVGETK